jgi:hypothetical protein
VAAPPKDPGLDPLRAGGAVVAVVLLLGVVALAAAARGPATGGAGREIVDPLATLLFVLAAIWVALLLVASPIMTGLTLTAGEPRQRRWFGNAFVGLFLLAALIAVLAVAQKLRGGAERGRDDSEPTGTTTEPDQRFPTIDPASVDWLVVGLVFAAALLGFGILAAVLVRPKGRPLSELEARRALETVLDETLDDLRAQRDPRRAVIAAYARMERSLGSYGLPRRPWEAPLEYMARVLTEVTSSGAAVRRLTALFERARFSEHAIDKAMKEDAIAAVAAVRDELRALTVT